MSGVVIPDPEGGLVWIHGEDPSNDPVKVQVTATGILKVTFDGIPASGEKLFAVEGAISETVSDTALAAGTNTLYGTTVPSGELWRVTQVSAVFISASITALHIGAVIGGVVVRVLHNLSPTTLQRYPVHTELFLDVGDRMFAQVETATLNDDLYLTYAGTKQVI